MNKKILIKFFIFFVSVLVCTEIYFYNSEKNIYKPIYSLQNKLLGFEAFKIKYYDKPKLFQDMLNPSIFQPSAGIEYTKKPILVMGCSYAEGAGLPLNQKFHYKLSEMTNRPVYNRAFGGGGYQHMYYILTHDKYMRDLQEPEYIVYVFINSHIERFYQYQFWDKFRTVGNLRYKLKEDGVFYEQKPILFPFWFLFTVKEIQEKFWINFMRKSPENKLFNTFVSFMSQTKKEALKKYPNTKFVILLYDDGMIQFGKDYINNSYWNLLRREGFIVINSNDLVHKVFSDEKYKTEDKIHPSERAWDELTPAFVKYLGL